MTKKIVKRTDANNEILYFYTHSDAVDVGGGNATTSLTTALNSKASASDLQALSDDALRKSPQSLSSQEKAQVHNNIGTESFIDDRAVRYDDAQVLGSEEKTQALTNLGLNGVDAEPTKNSQKMVRSGGVAEAIDNVQYARFDGIQETSVTLNTTTTATGNGSVLFYVPNNVFIYKVGSTYYTLWNNTNRLTNGFYNDDATTPHALTTKIFINTEDGLPYSFDGTNFTTVIIDDTPTAGSNNLVKSGGVQNELALGAVYDVSAKNPTAGSNNDGKFESLSALLSDANINTLIPIAVRKGGMSIKFVQSSDNKYVQYFLTKDEWSLSEADWQKMNLEEEVSQLDQETYNLFAKSSADVDNPIGTANYIDKNGVITSSSSYTIVAPIKLEPRQRILLNKGNSLYCGDNIAVLFKADSAGNWQETILYESHGFTQKVEYTNKSDSDIYIGICTYNNQRSYIIQTPQEAVSLPNFGYATMVSADNPADVSAKVITKNNFALNANTILMARLYPSNTADELTLNINNTGALPLYYAGTRASAANCWNADDYVFITTNGSAYYMTPLSALPARDIRTMVANLGITISHKINEHARRIAIIDGGEYITTLQLSDIGIRRNNYYINQYTGEQLRANTAIITNAVYLRIGDKITAFTGGNGMAVIAKSDTKPTDGTIYTPIEITDTGLTAPIEHIVTSEGYYSFCGHNSSQPHPLEVTIEKQEEIEPEDGKIEKLETQVESLDEIINGETITQHYTLDDLDDVGALQNYYLNSFRLEPIGGVTDVIITSPIYLRVGDEVECRTGGDGICLFAKSPSGTITYNTTGFISISGTATSYSGVISEDGWYVFSGRINRTDGTNLVVNVIKYSRGKGVQEQLDEKADKNDLTDINIPAIGLSVGADKVKDAIPSSPWFDADSQSSGFDYGTYLDDKLDSVPYGQRFIFITDYHYGSNNKKSAALIDYCRNRLGIKTIIHGGDVHNEYETAERAVQDWLAFNRDFVFRIGNDFKQILGDHDRNGRTGHTPISYEVLQKLITGYDSHELTFDNLYDEQVSELGWSSSDMSQYEAFKRMHYFFDDVTIKTRFICLVTRIISQGQGLVYDKLGDYDSGVLLLQMDFLYSALMSTPKGYNIVVVGHNVVGDKSYSVSVGGSTVPRYNVNEPLFKGYWLNVTKQLRSFINKTASSVNIQYLDWESDNIETKDYDFSNAPDVGIVFCMGGDVHWDIMAKSQLVNNTETLSTVEAIDLPSGTEPTVAIQGTINKNTDILHIVTMTDGGDRGYKGIVEAPAQNYDDNTDSFIICKPNTIGTIDSQAFDIVTIANDGIYFTRIGSGFDRKIIFD